MITKPTGPLSAEDVHQVYLKLGGTPFGWFQLYADELNALLASRPSGGGTASYMQRLPGGICFAHGPYTEMQCPKCPACATERQNPEYVKMGTAPPPDAGLRAIGWRLFLWGTSMTEQEYFENQQFWHEQTGKQ